MMVLLTVCCVVAAFLIERFPRRRLLFVTGIGAQLSLLVFVVCASLLPSPHKTAEEDGWLSLALRAGATLGLSGYIVCYG
jgi:hypothetical protein